MGSINPMPMQPGFEAPTLNPPQSVDPLAVAQAIQSLRQQQAMAPLQQQQAQQQVQQGQLQIQQQQRALQDQEIFRQALIKQYGPDSSQDQGSGAQPGAAPPPNGGAPAQPMQSVPGLVTPVPAGAVSGAPAQAPPVAPQRSSAAPPIVGIDPRALAASGMSGSGVQGIMSQQLEYAAKYATTDETKQKIIDQRHKDAGSAVLGLYDQPPDQQQVNYPKVRDLVNQLAPEERGMMPDQLPPDPTQAKQALALAVSAFGAHDQIVANAKSAAETAKAIAEAATNTQQGRLAKFEADTIQNWQKTVGTPQDTGPQTIKSALNFNATDAGNMLMQYQNAVAHGDYKGAQDTIHQAITIANEKNPEAMQQAAAQAASTAKAEGAARLPFEQSLQASGANLETQRTVMGKVQDAKADYNQSVASSTAIKNAIKLASSGNEVAASQVPGLAAAFQLAMFDIRRLPANVAESMGSHQSKISNAYNSLVKNQPINWNELKDVAPYLDTITGAARQRYNGVAQSIEEGYKLEPSSIPRAYAVGDKFVGPGGKTRTVKSVDPVSGRVWAE